jgi:CBS-domain-containing membrane protein
MVARPPSHEKTHSAVVRWRTALAIWALTLALLQGIVIASWLAGLALMLPSWASSIAILIGCRDIPSARARAACYGHLICGAVGITAFLIAGPYAHPWAMGLAAPSVAIAVPLMWWLRCYHPPAASNAAIPFFTAATMTTYSLAVVLGAVLLFAAATTLDRFSPPPLLQTRLSKRGGQAG